MAFSLTGDLGCEYGGHGSFVSAQGRIINNNVNCHHNTATSSKQTFAGWMLYNRWWFKKDMYGITLGGGAMANPGRYLTLLPPINGADAITGSPYFTQNPGDPYKAWDASLTFDWMPKQYITFRTEYRLSPRQRAVLDGSRRNHTWRQRDSQHDSQSRAGSVVRNHYVRAGSIPVRHTGLHLCGWKPRVSVPICGRMNPA